jgi:trehalose synthase
MEPRGLPFSEGWPVGVAVYHPHLVEVPVTAVSPGLFKQVLSPSAFRDLVAALVGTRSRLGQRVVWNVNSTSRGGGVAEMLQSLIAYARGAGIDIRWLVIQGNPEFFKVTKRIHNQIQGFQGDGGELGDREHDAYEQSLLDSGRELKAMVRPGDIVLLHDPQTAGLAPELKEAGARVVWRCHVGIDSPNEWALKAWEFLGPYLQDADVYVFSRSTFAWKALDPAKIAIIPPSIDPFTPKNNVLTQARIAAILIQAGLLNGYAAATPYYVRPTGTVGLVERRAEVLEVAAPRPYERLVVQVSRWDRLKDPLGVLNGFVNHVAREHGAHLVLAGPEVGAVADDPEGAVVLDEVTQAWKALPEPARERVHLVCLPMQDAEENAVIVNALQRRAEVVVQKSLAEGFGLTVSEAMWKGRPVVASRIGGIQDQVEQEKTGLLLNDPADLQEFGAAVTRLLVDADSANQMGAAAEEHVRENFLNDRHLKQYADLLGRLDR